MLKNYLISAYRSLRKQKFQSIITVLGLAVGFMASILMYTYVNYELNFDESQSRKSDLFRVVLKFITEDKREFTNASVPLVVRDVFRESIPELEGVTTLLGMSFSIKKGNEFINEPGFIVDADYPNMFDLEVLHGDAKAALKEKNRIVIDESISDKYFGTENSVGKSMTLHLGDRDEEFEVGAVISTMPTNSNIAGKVFINVAHARAVYGESFFTGWGEVISEVFALVRPGTDIEKLTQKSSEAFQAARGEGRSSTVQAYFQPLTDIHINTELGGGIVQSTNPLYLVVLSIIAAFVVIVACINFVIISIGRAGIRLKEVGIRKSIGATKGQLLMQFWVETSLITALSLFIAFVSANLVLPFFNQMVGIDLKLNYEPTLVLFTIIIFLLVSILSGFYPAWLMSKFNVVEVFKNKWMTSHGKNGWLLRGLIVAQYAIAGLLIAGTLIINNQINYFFSKDLGYTKDELIVLRVPAKEGADVHPNDMVKEGQEKFELIKNESKSIAGINSMAFSMFTTAEAGWPTFGFLNPDNEQVLVRLNMVSSDYIPLMDIKLLEGRNFNPESSMDRKGGVIINQAAANFFKWKNPIGKQLPNPGFGQHEVIGLIADYNFETLHSPVDPLILVYDSSFLFGAIRSFYMGEEFIPRVVIRLNEGVNPQSVMDELGIVWKRLYPNQEFNYYFANDRIQRRYENEKRLRQIIISGSILSLIISCLGLFGMATLAVNRRIKEIGVRKALGAGIGQIIWLINKEFTLLILIALLISFPVTYYLQQEWLNGFAYQAPVSVLIYVLSLILTMGVAWATVSVQSLRASKVNPSESLRYE